MRPSWNGRHTTQAAVDTRAWDNSGLSFDASVRIPLIDRDAPDSFQSLRHLLREGR